MVPNWDPSSRRVTLLQSEVRAFSHFGWTWRQTGIRWGHPRDLLEVPSEGLCPTWSSSSASSVSDGTSHLKVVYHQTAHSLKLQSDSLKCTKGRSVASLHQNADKDESAHSPAFLIQNQVPPFSVSVHFLCNLFPFLPGRNKLCCQH